MDRQELIECISSREKEIRSEFGFSQEQMAGILGISKKSLVQTEMGRRNMQWTECVTLAVTFAQSRILQETFGGELSDMIRAIAFAKTEPVYPHTMGGRVWWNQIAEKNGYRLQQNMISRHFRVLDPADGRMFSSFDETAAVSFFEEVAGSL